MVKSVLTLTTVSPTPSSPPLVAQLETQMMKLLKTETAAETIFFKKKKHPCYIILLFSFFDFMNDQYLDQTTPSYLSYFNIMIKVHTVVGS